MFTFTDSQFTAVEAHATRVADASNTNCTCNMSAEIPCGHCNIWCDAYNMATHTLHSNPVHSMHKCDSPWDNDKSQWMRAFRCDNDVSVIAPLNYFVSVETI